MNLLSGGRGGGRRVDGEKSYCIKKRDAAVIQVHE